MAASRRAVAGCLIALLTCALAGCNEVSKTAVANCKTDPSAHLKSWQGAWKLVSAIWNGEPQRGDVRWLIDADSYTVRRNGKDAEHNTFKLDACQKHIDVFHHNVPKGTYGGSLKGVYEIESDRLRVTYDPTARQYPKSLSAAPGSKLMFYEFRRESR
jgi:uncharacterized protein (TIGR03067 family)